MNFINQFTPDAINDLCKKYKVKVLINFYDPEEQEEIVTKHDDGTETTTKEGILIWGSGYGIKSWNDLFQIDNTNALFFDKEEQEEMK
jgi:hypothetical protein